MDIEGSEWPVLKQLLQTDLLKYIKQLLFEIHTPVFADSSMTVNDYASVYNDLVILRDVWGYRLYREHHSNGCCGRFATLTPPHMIDNGKRKLCCYELYFLNSNFT